MKKLALVMAVSFVCSNAYGRAWKDAIHPGLRLAALPALSGVATAGFAYKIKELEKRRKELSALLKTTGKNTNNLMDRRRKELASVKKKLVVFKGLALLGFVATLFTGVKAKKYTNTLLWEADKRAHNPLLWGPHTGRREAEPSDRGKEDFNKHFVIATRGEKLYNNEPDDFFRARISRQNELLEILNSYSVGNDPWARFNHALYKVCDLRKHEREWLFREAEQRATPEQLFRFAHVYNEPRLPVFKDAAAARRCFTKAAAQGFAPAQEYLDQHPELSQ